MTKNGGFGRTRGDIPIIDGICAREAGTNEVTEQCVSLVLYPRTTARHQRAMVDFSVANETQIIITLFFELTIFHKIDGITI